MRSAVLRRSLGFCLCLGLGLAGVAAVPSALLAQQVGAPRRTQPALLLEGRLVDVLGDALPAASVRVVQNGQDLASTRSDAQGLFRLRCAPGPGTEVWFAADGKVERRLPCRLGVTNLGTVVLEDGAPLRGRVVDAAGLPVAGATVVITADTFHCEVRTDAAGQYEAASVPLRPLRMRAWFEQHHGDLSWRHLGPATCDVRLQSPGQTRLVRIVGLPAAALAQAQLELTSFDLALHRDGGRLPLRADGTAEIVVSATCLVQVAVPGFRIEPAGQLVGPEGATELAFRAVARTAGPAGAVLRGRLVDDRGRGVGGVQLIAADKSQVEVGAGTSAADGSFQLPVSVAPTEALRLGLELGAWQVTERPQLRAGRCWTERVVTAQVAFELLVAPANGVDGELRTASGERLGFTEVEVTTRDRPKSPLLVATTDRLGAFSLRGLPADDYVIAAAGPDGSIVTAAVTIGAGRVERELRWHTQRSGTIEGRVVDPDGRPMPGIDLLLAAPALREGASGPEDEGPLAARVTTDRHGRFRCRGRLPGDYTVVAVGDPSIEGGLVEVIAGQVARLELRGNMPLPRPEPADGLVAPAPNGR